MKFQMRSLFLVGLFLLQIQNSVFAQSDDEFGFFDEEASEGAKASEEATLAPPPPPPEEALEEELDFVENMNEEPVTDPTPEVVPEPEVVELAPSVPEPEVVELPPSESESVVEAPPVVEPPPVVSPQPSVVAGVENTSEEPDFQRERRFHEIFMKYNQSPTPTEVWGQAKGQVTQEYAVQKGDTLWSISKTLFNDSNYWPKIWSLNVNIITNPHEIRPGMKVSFVEGNFEEPPVLNLLAEGSPVGEDVVELANPEAAKEKLNRHVYKKAQPIPASLPEYQSGYFSRNTDVKFEVNKFDYPQFPEVISTYVESVPLVGVGRVLETELGMNTAVENQYIFVRMKPGETQRSFQVIRSTHKIPLSLSERGQKAYVYEILGTIELMELTNREQNIYRARVVQSFGQIVKDSLLRPGVDLPMMSPTPGVPGQVPYLRVIGGIGEKKILFGDHNYVFLSKGSLHGVQVNQEYNIYANNLVRNPESLARSGDRVIGRLKVVKVSEKVSTAFVLDVKEPLMLNDYASNEQLERLKK